MRDVACCTLFFKTRPKVRDLYFEKTKGIAIMTDSLENCYLLKMFLKILRKKVQDLNSENFHLIVDAVSMFFLLVVAIPTDSLENY